MEAKQYVESEAEFMEYSQTLKGVACPRCRVVGCLIRHGRLYGYPAGNRTRGPRGWRIFCSNRGRRGGCGRTHSVLLAELLARRIVSTVGLWQLLHGIGCGLSVKAAWERAHTVFCPDTAYRLWKAFCGRLSALRTALCRQTAPPRTGNRHPALQTIAHFLVAFPKARNPLQSFQLQTQLAVLSSRPFR
jgi:hypothetical protein